MSASTVLLVVLAALPLAQVLLGCIVLRAPYHAAPVMVGPEVLRSMTARSGSIVAVERSRIRRLSKVLGGQPRPDPLRVNRKLEPGARLEAAAAVRCGLGGDN